MNDAEQGDPTGDARRAAFFRRHLAPGRTPVGHRELGTTALARQLGLADDQLGGHWCNRCQGIWYGCTLEVECPACGNRRG
jgi:hypothetical protein